MADPIDGRVGPAAPESQGVWEAASSAFLRRQLHDRRMRLAVLRTVDADDALETVGPWRLAFGRDPAVLDQATAWVADQATHRSRAVRDDLLPLVVPRLRIVILVVGSRGDVQPFLPIAQRIALRHRVRIATHAEFRGVVEEAGLEFYPLAGDPRELVDYMVRTGGRVLPTSIGQIAEDVPRQRQIIADILASTWRACTEPDPERADAAPFVADAIIANPPSFGHIHVAEALHVPLHIVFTMPWTPTTAFPHPMTRLARDERRLVRNWLSYAVVDESIWLGIGDLVNQFRVETLGLPPIGVGAGGSSSLNDLEVPFTYLWPASVVPKPDDWGAHIDLASFIFSDHGADYQPPADLAAFLAAGEPPVYVGFGSCVVEDPEALTRTIYAALEQAGLRGLVSRGWGKLGGEPPPNVHLIDDVPHDWLFARCRAVCHHGGAGTTAAGLRAGLPTVVVPFFGDQFFWGRVVADSGAGPEPIPIDELDAARLGDAFKACLADDVLERAQALGVKVRAEDGVALVLESLYRHLPIAAMACTRDGGHLATVYCDDCRERLCEPCYAAAHANHASHPYRYVDWGVRAPFHVTQELTDFFAAAGAALDAGLSELGLVSAPPRRGGVVLADADEERPGSDGEPVRRRDRRRS